MPRADEGVALRQRFLRQTGTGRRQLVVLMTSSSGLFSVIDSHGVPGEPLRETCFAGLTAAGADTLFERLIAAATTDGYATAKLSAAELSGAGIGPLVAPSGSPIALVESLPLGVASRGSSFWSIRENGLRHRLPDPSVKLDLPAVCWPRTVTDDETATLLSRRDIGLTLVPHGLARLLVHIPSSDSPVIYWRDGIGRADYGGSSEICDSLLRGEGEVDEVVLDGWANRAGGGLVITDILRLNRLDVREFSTTDRHALLLEYVTGLALVDRWPHDWQVATIVVGDDRAEVLATKDLDGRWLLRALGAGYVANDPSAWWLQQAEAAPYEAMAA